MAKNFTALQAKMPPEARRRAEAKAEATLRSEFRGHHTYLPPSAMATSAGIPGTSYLFATISHGYVGGCVAGLGRLHSAVR